MKYQYQVVVLLKYSVCQFNDYVAGKVTDSTTGIGIQATPTVSATMDVKDGQVK